MYIIDENTVVAYNYADLRDALINDNGYEYVYLGNDIVMTAGITINASKTSLIIDGLFEEASSERRTITDTGTNTGSIMITRTINITFQNLVIAGRNYYGMPRVYDNSYSENTILTYINVKYTGPQMTWHANGRTRYIDCDITITDSGYSDVHEVAEVRWVDIGGNTIIHHNNSNAYPVFLFRKIGSSLIILENSNVEISTYYDFFTCENDFPQFIIEPRAIFTLTTQRGISRSESYYVSSFIVGEYASFRYTRNTANGATAALYVGTFTVNKGAKVYMQSDFSNDGQLLRFRSISPTRGLYINDPKSFVLYNSGTQTNTGVFYFESSTPFLFFGGQVNFWRDVKSFPIAGTFDDEPLYQWHMEDWSHFGITGTAVYNSTTVVPDTYGLPEDPNLSNLQLHQARAFSVGDLPLSVNRIIIEDKRITGNTDSEARVLVKYTSGVIGCRVECEVNEDTYFLASLENEEELTFNTPVTVASNTPFLITTLVIAASYAEDLHIDAPELIVFEIRPIAFNPVILPRFEEDPENPQLVTVTDVREIKTAWKVWVKITGPLRTEEGDILTDAVVFVPDSGELQVLDTEEWIEAYFDDNLETETPISWEESKGILARINNKMMSGRRYTTQILWGVTPEE